MDIDDNTSYVKTAKNISFFTYTGKKLNLADINKDDIEIADIAHGLSNQCRYNGQTNDFYSVAEHTIHLVSVARRGDYSNDMNMLKAILLHDATEAYLGDLVYHLKASLPEYKVIENRLMAAIYERFGVTITPEIEKYIKTIDRSICVDEMKELMKDVDPVLYDMGYGPLGVSIYCYTPSYAEKLFMDEAQYLGLADVVNIGGR